MSGQPDLERAGPSIDSQRDEQIREEDSKNAITTGESSTLVDAWMHRLQMITLVTTFLASIDGELFTLTSAAPSQVTANPSLKSQEFVYSCFSGALIFHVCASILGYTASFALIRYELVDSETTPGPQSNEQGQPSSPSEVRQGKQHLRLKPTSPLEAVQILLPPSLRLQAHSRTFTPPLALLSRCFYTTLALSGVGFILALLGITAYAWEGLQQNVGIFTTACLGISLLAGIWAVL